MSEVPLYIGISHLVGVPQASPWLQGGSKLQALLFFVLVYPHRPFLPTARSHGWSARCAAMQGYLAHQKTPTPRTLH